MEIMGSNHYPRAYSSEHVIFVHCFFNWIMRTNIFPTHPPRKALRKPCGRSAQVFHLHYVVLHLVVRLWSLVWVKIASWGMKNVWKARYWSAHCASNDSLKCKHDCRIQCEWRSAFNAIQAQWVLHRPFCEVMTQGKIRSFRVRLYSGFLTETQVSPNGNLSSRCGKHLCMLHFRKTVWFRGNAFLELRDWKNVDRPNTILSSRDGVIMTLRALLSQVYLSRISPFCKRWKGVYCIFPWVRVGSLSNAIFHEYSLEVRHWWVILRDKGQWFILRLLSLL